MNSVVDYPEKPAAEPAARERGLLAIVASWRANFTPNTAELGEISLSSRLEKNLGIDSLGRTELVLRLERAFGARLPISLVAEADTVGDLLRVLEQARRPERRLSPRRQRRPWLRFLPPERRIRCLTSWNGMSISIQTVFM